MTDDLEDLEQALAQEPGPAPDAAAKARAIQRAVTAFEKNFSDRSQGSSPRDRLKERANAIFATISGRRSMRLSPALMGGASLGVLALAVLSTSAIMTSHFNYNPPVTAPLRQDDKTAVEKKEVAREQDAVTAPPPALGTEAERAAGAKAPKPVVTAVDPGASANRSALHKLGVKRRPDVGVRGLYSRQALEGFRAPGLPADRPVTGFYEEQGRDRFTDFNANPVRLVAETPVSTFSIDVDTASYAFMRRSLNNNLLPQKDAVRVEELINYFPYDYAGPQDRATPFKSTVSVMPSPWNPETKLIHIGIKGFELAKEEKPRANLVFLLDTSGSMNAPDKLPLLQNAMKLLLERLDDDDTVSIVTYAGSAGTVLEPTSAKDKTKILAALGNLHAGGSTAGGEGIRQAYQLAEQTFDKKAVNRVILATDGDFNVGIRDRDELKSFIERKRQSGVFLSVLGFGRGNYNDDLMQALAQNGNGNAAYIDTLNEARKVLVEEATGTLFTIAKDVKIQVEFNPATVAEYRLIGYETRILNREDFNNDKVDAGDIGSGHTVTAIYEITPKGSGARLVDDLRYGKPDAEKQASETSNDEYAFLKIRYKLPDADKSTLVTTPVTRALEHASIDGAPREARFATSVAAFGQLLRGGRYTGAFTYDDVVSLAQGAKGADPFGYRAEFVNLARFAKSAAAIEKQKK